MQGRNQGSGLVRAVKLIAPGKAVDVFNVRILITSSKSSEDMFDTTR